MQLDARLQAVMDFVAQGSRVADIGADHAYLAIALIQSKKALRVIATEKNEGPYASAKRMVRESGLVQEIQVRMGDGLQTLEPGEVDTVCIAGMGGSLICEILSANPTVMAGVDSLILQPMSDAARVRTWIYRHNWYITDEALALSDGHIYEVISAHRGRRKKPDPILLEIGPVLWQKKPELLRHHIEQLLFQSRRAVAEMEKSEKAKSSQKYKDLIKHSKELEERLKW